ncbi:unnamed protein product [Pelagomonas calceolata]|uniref:Uncharacterized protein n=1 Tax=Pelagomonas calceolata TaxID=35677 RepID=A0A8J2SLT2_9STRA|nr:unnamed protein product [Pelagomonas calceolata]
MRRGELSRRRGLVVVQLEAHAVVDLVVLERDVVLEDGVPLLDADLLGPGAALRRDELFQVADRVVLVALHPNLLAEAVVADDLDHFSCSGDGARRRLMSVVVFEAAVGSAAVALRRDARTGCEMRLRRSALLPCRSSDSCSCL